MIDTADGLPTKITSAGAERLSLSLRTASITGMNAHVKLSPKDADALADLLDTWLEITLSRAVQKMQQDRAQAEASRTMQLHLWVLALCQSIVIWNTMLSEVAR